MSRLPTDLFGVADYAITRSTSMIKKILDFIGFRKRFQFENLEHCRRILKFAASYLLEKGYREQASDVSRAVSSVEQDLQSQQVQKWIKERDKHD